VEERKGRGGGATVPFAGAHSPMPGSGETHTWVFPDPHCGSGWVSPDPSVGPTRSTVWVSPESDVGWRRQGRFGLFLWAYLLFLSHFNFFFFAMGDVSKWD
jgi:hypothetical protein